METFGLGRFAKKKRKRRKRWKVILDQLKKFFPAKIKINSLKKKKNKKKNNEVV